MNTALQELVMNNRRIRFDEVRTEGRLVVSLLRSWGMIVALNPDSGGPCIYGDDISSGRSSGLDPFASDRFEI